MRQYKDYMDRVKVSDTLHQRLLGLEAAGKRPVPWKKYGAMAAALILVCALGAWAAGRLPGGGSYQLALVPGPEPETDVKPDIAPEGPGGVAEPGEKALGSYDVARDGVTAHYILPYIEYGEAQGSGTALDWDVPPGSVKRDLTQEEIAALMGGEDVLSDHLAWGEEYALSGWAAWYGDGSFWGAYINGVLPNYGGAAREFEFAVTAGQTPPTCIAYPGSVEQDIGGVTVTADKSDWEVPWGSSAYEVHERRVSFLKGEYGFRFAFSSGDPELTEEMVSRLVRWVIDSGVAVDRLSSDGAVLAHPWEADPSTGVGEPNWNDSGETSYDPGELAERGCSPGKAVPEADSFLTCRTCGGGIPDQTGHYCKADGSGGYMCGFCGEVFPEGKVHSHEMCGDPPAPVESGETVCGYPLADDPRWNDAGPAAPEGDGSRPPVLRVVCTEGCVDGKSGNYEWSRDLGGGETATAVACGLHPLDSQRDAPTLTTGDGTALLGFPECPDRVQAVCWPDSEWGNTAAASRGAGTAQNGQGYALTLEDGGWIYEIAAGWEGRGEARYVFYIIKD